MRLYLYTYTKSMQKCTRLHYMIHGIAMYFQSHIGRQSQKQKTRETNTNEKYNINRWSTRRERKRGSERERKIVELVPRMQFVYPFFLFFAFVFLFVPLLLSSSSRYYSYVPVWLRAQCTPVWVFARPISTIVVRENTHMHISSMRLDWCWLLCRARINFIAWKWKHFLSYLLFVRWIIMVVDCNRSHLIDNKMFSIFLLFIECNRMHFIDYNTYDS